MKRWAILAVVAASLSPFVLRASPWDLFNGGFDIKDWGFGASLTMAHLRNDFTTKEHTARVSNYFDQDDTLLDVYVEKVAAEFEERTTRLRFGVATVTFDSKTSSTTPREDIEATAPYVGVVQSYNLSEMGFRLLGNLECFWEGDIGIAYLSGIRETLPTGEKQRWFRNSKDPFFGAGVGFAYPLGKHLRASVGYRWRHFGDYDQSHNRNTRDFDVETYGFEGGLSFRF